MLGRPRPLPKNAARTTRCNDRTPASGRRRGLRSAGRAPLGEAARRRAASRWARRNRSTTRALKGQARALAGAPLRAGTRARCRPSIDALDWDQYQSIRFRADHALWADREAALSASSSSTSACTSSGRCACSRWPTARRQELAYDPAMFDYGKSGLRAARMPPDLGFAGFRVNFHSDLKHDIAAFLGASYFRAVGRRRASTACRRAGWRSTPVLPRRGVPGLRRRSTSSARPPDSSTLIVYALLDSPSVSRRLPLRHHAGRHDG